MESEAVAELYAAFAAHDPAEAIAVLEKGKSGGLEPEQLFDQLFAPAMSILGAAWARGAVDEYAFTQAAVTAEQAMTFVTPAVAAPDTGVTVLLGTVLGDVHDIDKAIIAAALTEAGHRVIDLGSEARPAEFLEKAEQTGAQVAVVFANLTSGEAEVARIRETLSSSERVRVALLVSGGSFTADAKRAKAVGANGVVRGVESALRLVPAAAARAGRRP